jgi:hypothetical protein
MSSIRAPNPVYAAIRARADDGSKWPRQIADRIYNDQFLSELKERFGFDALEPQTAKALRDIAFRYIVFRREENQPEYRKRRRRDFLRLEKATSDFLALLKQHEESDIASDISLVASIDPKWDDLRKHQPGNHNARAYVHTLRRLLELMKATAAWHAQQMASHSGRHANLGLHELTRKAAEFWIEVLNHRFTLDYHEGAGITRAFEFIKALVTPLDDVTDKQIITAMRAQIAARRKLGLRRD